MKFSVDIKKGEKFYIARIPELGVTTQGKTKKEAEENLKEAIELQLETIADYAIKHGGVKIEKGKLTPPRRSHN
jgi:predicted RNase H-like HicB family nuclease